MAMPPSTKALVYSCMLSPIMMLNATREWTTFPGNLTTYTLSDCTCGHGIISPIGTAAGEVQELHGCTCTQYLDKQPSHWRFHLQSQLLLGSSNSFLSQHKQ